MLVQPYLSFEGRCEEALAFYRDKLGAKVDMTMRYSESPDKNACNGLPPGSEKKIMHSSFHLGEQMLMATDGMCSGKPSFKGISLTISVPDVAAADKTFKALSDGGQVQMPLTETFFSPRFGMLADKFGVPWMVIVDDGKH